MRKEPAGVKSAKITALGSTIAACILLLGTVSSALITRACNKETQDGGQSVSGSRNVVVSGSKVTINVSGDTATSQPDSSTAKLSLIGHTFTHDGAFDIKLLNRCDTACFITRIDVTCLQEHSAWVKKLVRPSARYILPIDGIKIGETRSLAVSFNVPPKSPERILLYVNSSRIYTLYVTMYYNSDEVVGFTNRTWNVHALSSGDEQPKDNVIHASSTYILWDGHRESPYAETNRVHDCVYFYDGMVSCQDVRNEFLRMGYIHTMFFGCGSGEVAMTSTSGGLFTQSLDNVLKKDPHVTIRNAVCMVNQAMHAQGVDQNCEVVTRRDVLDQALMDSTVADAPHVIFIYDFCRTPISAEDRKNVRWHRIKPGEFGPLVGRK